MAYIVYLDNVALPVTPSNLQIVTTNKNTTLDLINGSEINILKGSGLKTVAFECLIPQTLYPFAIYPEGFKDATFYLDILEALKNDKKTFQFIVSRESQSGQPLFNTNIKVSLEDFTPVEDAGSGTDIKVSINLKEFKEYGTKFVIIEPEIPPVVADPPRPVDPAPEPARRLYTVVSGDCLWAICRSQLGDGSRCWDVAASNGIADANLIFPGQVIDLTGY